jgi:hypothetical protein
MSVTPQAVVVKQGANALLYGLLGVGLLALALVGWWFADEWSDGRQAIEDVARYKAEEAERARKEAETAAANEKTQDDLETIVEDRGARRRETAVVFESARRAADRAEARDPDRARATSRVGVDFIGVWNLAATRGGRAGPAAADPGGAQGSVPGKPADPDR